METKQNKHVITALVQNEPGVLAHVAGMFAARGFNIDSLVVGRTGEGKVFQRVPGFILLSFDYWI